jgi:Xaa-Pro aminopeptidase
MKQEIKSRIEKLRNLMRKDGLSAYLINGSDPHMSEYVPVRWQTREFISGFSGSYGWLVITLEKAVLWTDSRYYLQASQQLEGTNIEMFKARDEDTLTLDRWIGAELKSGETLGFDGACYSTAEVTKLEKFLLAKGIQINVESDLLEKVWADRPSLPENKAFLHPVKWAGESRSDKFLRIMKALERRDADLMVLSALDDIGWTFNLRGADVDCNPVALAFGLVGKNGVQLFIDPQKLDASAKEELMDDGVVLKPYDQFYEALKPIQGKTIFVDPVRTNCLITALLKEQNMLVEGLSIPTLFKSLKNEAEIVGMKKAHITDGMALLSFQLWLEETLEEESITEYDIAQKVTEYRAQKVGYIGDSFYPIVGYQEHGAIVHYHVTPESASEIKPEGIVLIDSGGQYEFGTTDITRTFALGPVSEATKRDYTLVLKGMIRLSRIKFPKGTCGCHLDVLARAALWNENLNYGHGTGHGVGAFMNVHEGPGSIRPDLNDQQIRPGNIFSNEPGMYREGEYGIRIENLVLCVDDVSNEFGEFYRFETLTRYPIDTRLIEVSLLDEEEKAWLNAYHQQVFSALSPFTNSDQFKLLKRLTQAI